MVIFFVYVSIIFSKVLGALWKTSYAFLKFIFGKLISSSFRRVK